MQKFVLILLIVSVKFGFSQNWFKQQSVNTGIFRDITFINADTGYIAVEGGEYEILKTTDGGSSWQGFATNSWSGINAVCFVNQDTGYAVGGGGGGTAVIRKTYDSGANWDIVFPLSSGPSNWPLLRDVYFTDTQTGYAAGSSASGKGIIIKTENAGVSWDSLNFEANYPLKSIYFTSPDTGYSVGGNGTIFKTNNAGTTWSHYSHSITAELNSLVFVSPDTGYIAGANGTILKTVNAGDSWSEVNSGITENLNSLYFLDPKTGYIGGENGKVWRTENNGDNWKALDTDFSDRIEAIYFKDNKHGIAVGYSGLYALSNFAPALLDTIPDIYISEDSGEHLVTENLNNYFTDSDNTTLNFSVDKSGNGISVQIVDSSFYVSTVQDSFGLYPVFVTAMDPFEQFIADTFLVHVSPVNDPPGMTAVPDTIITPGNEVVLLNLWDLVEDDQTTDSDITFNFSQADSNLQWSYNPVNGDLSISVTTFIGESKLYITAEDDSNSTAMDSILFKIILPAVENFYAVAHDQSVSLFWSPRLYNQLYQYYLYRNTTDDFTSAVLIHTLSKADSSFIDTNLVNFTSYFYWISAVDSFNNVGVLSLPIEVQPIDLTPPPIPTILFVRSVYDRELRIYVQPIEVADFNHFNLYKNTVNDSLYAQLLTSSSGGMIVDKDFESGYYYYWVSAVDNYGNESKLSRGDSIYVVGRIGITNLFPEQNAIGVDPSSQITVKFDRKLNTSKLTMSNVLVKGKYGVSYHIGQLDYDSVSSTLTFNPAQPFLFGDIVTVTLKDFQDSSGAELPAMPYQWQFTTKILDTTVLFTNIFNYDTENESIKSSAAGDFDGDGDIDLAITGGSVQIFMNNGATGFEYESPVNISPSKMIPVDFDNDFDLDIIAYQGFRIYVLTNNGDGQFSTYQYPVGEYYNSTNILAADWSLDGYPSLMVDGGSRYYVHNDSGSLTYEVYWGLRSFGSESGDIDNDGLPDFINLQQSYNINVSFGNGENASGFSLYDTTYSIDGNPGGYVQTDFNGDSYLDLAVATVTSNSIVLFFNNNKGRFPNTEIIPFDVIPKILAFADFNGDNTTDLLISLEEQEKWVILFNDGNASFTEKDFDYYETGDVNILTADFSMDGVMDFIVTNPAHGDFTYLYMGEIPLTAPKNLSAKVINTKDVELNWTPPQKSIQSYQVYKGTDSLTLNLLSSISDTFFIDTTVVTDGKYFYAVKATDSSGAQSTFSNMVNIDMVVSALDSQNELPMEYYLSQNYPNPFNPETVISYELKETSDINLTIYNVLGERIATLYSGRQPAGRYSVNFNANNFASGFYFYKLTAGSYTRIRRMLLLK